MPPSPYHQVCAFIACQQASTSSGSRPARSGAKPSAMIATVALQASGHMAIASPQPLMPASVSTRRSTVMRSLSKSFGSGQRRMNGANPVMRIWGSGSF